MQEFTEPAKLPTKNVTLIIFIPIAVSFVFAVLHKFSSAQTFSSFVYYGAASVIFNLLLAFVYLFHYLRKSEKKLEDNFILVIRVITLAIPFAGFYALTSLLSSGVDTGAAFFCAGAFCVAIGFGSYVRSRPKEMREKIRTRFFQYYGIFCAVLLGLMFVWLVFWIITIVTNK